MKICPKCQSQYSGDETFCQNCGTLLITQNEQPAKPEGGADNVKKCPKCQAELLENAAFCAMCGTAIEEKESVQTPAAADTTPAQSAPAASAVGAYGMTSVGAPISPAAGMHTQARSGVDVPANEVLSVVKKVLTSPLALVALIACTASVIFGVVTAFTISGSYMNIFDTMARLEGVDIDELFYDTGISIEKFVSGLSLPMAISTVISMMPVIFILVGLWMTFASIKSRKDGELTVNTTGLMLTKVVIIVQLVMFCIGIAITLILTVMLAGVFSVLFEELAAGEGDQAAAVVVEYLVSVFAVIFIAVFAVIVTMRILVIAKTLKTLNTVKKTLETGVPSDNVSVFVAVMSIMGGIGLALNSFSALLFSIPAWLFIASQATALICYGALISNYRKNIRALMIEYLKPKNNWSI